MADSQDKLTPSDEVKLAELEKQLAKEKHVEPASNKKQPSAANKHIDDKQSKSADTFAKTSRTKGDLSSHAANSTTTTSAKTGVLWFFTIVNLLLLAAMLGAGYWFWLDWKIKNDQQIEGALAQQVNLQQQQDEILQQRNSLQQQQKEIAQSLAQELRYKDDLQQQNQILQANMQGLVEQLEQTNLQVQTNQRNLLDISGRRPADWLLAEADYLIRIAGRKLWLEHDVKTASMLLTSADSRIEDLDDPSLLPLRAKLAEDLLALQQVNQVSSSSVALALGAMVNQVDSLPLAYFKKPDNDLAEENVTGSIDDWRSNLARNWQEATKNFFSIKKVTTEIKPFMSEQQQWLAREQLKFRLLQAQGAALQENSALYQQFLQSAFGILEKLFDNNTGLVKQFTADLNDLQQTDFELNLPEQFKVTPVIQDLVERRLSSRFVNGSN